MSSVHAIILGIVQGITEFLPISSSGHLIFLPVLFGWKDQGLLFDIVVHLGSFVAVVWFFRKKIVSLAKAFSHKEQTNEKKLAWYILLSIIPAGVFGLLIGESPRSAQFVAYSLIFWGILLGVADWYQKKQQGKLELDAIGKKEAAFISLVQAIALIPGTSRSGITMTAGLFSGLSKSAAAEFSFLMSVPVIAVAGAVKIVDYISQGATAVPISSLVFGFLAAAVSGYISISFLLKLIKKKGFFPFVLYRVVVGLAILLFLV